MPKLRHSRGLPIEQIAHADLTDMPDTAGTNSNHDARYYTEAEIDTMLSDGTIDHLNLSNIGINTHAQIDTHIADLTIHFTEASIDHTAILNIGVNTHAQIDTHIADVLTNPHSVTFTQVGAIQDAVNTVNDTHIDWGLGANQVSTTDMTEGTNLYFTNERVDDRVNVLIQDGTGITWTYNDVANTLTGDCDLTWAELDKTVSDIADITTKSHTSLTDKGTNTHAQIDTHITAYNSHDHSAADPTQVDHVDLLNKGTNTHAQIDTAVTASTNHIADSSDPHGATLTQTNITSSGNIAGGDTLTIVTGDHGAAATDEVVNVCYGTGDPPAANTTKIGTVFHKYTA